LKIKRKFRKIGAFIDEKEVWGRGQRTLRIKGKVRIGKVFETIIV